MKKTEKEELGDNHVSEDVEKVGWGVEKAQESYRADASRLTFSLSTLLVFFFGPSCAMTKLFWVWKLRLFQQWQEY